MRSSIRVLRKRAGGRTIPHHSAFTLVEMLIAVALMTLLMTLFAQIFALASDILGRQRGISVNDQSERNLQTMIRGDLDRRTFRSVVPFDITGTPSTSDLSNGLGYFHIDEGDPADDLDDILQFTVKRDNDEEPFYGRATSLTTPFTNDPNQPEFDDELLTSNQTGASRYAEVAYFLRFGRLYRRVMLLRDPKIGTPPSEDPTLGAAGTGGPIITGVYTNDFWKNFDYSAYFNTTPHFLGVNDLNNDPLNAVALGLPNFRFGFDSASGQPRRSVKNAAAAPLFFIGRFTQQETSDPAFKYPGQANSTAPASDPMAPGTFLNFDPANGYVSEFKAGTRVSEDVLMENVHCFDIKVLDVGFTVGNDDAPGVAGDGTPGGVGDDDGDGVDDNPEELGWPGTDDWLGPDNQPGVAGVDDDGINGADDAGEIGWPGSDDAKLTDFKDLGHGVGTPKLYGGASLGVSANAAFGNCFDTWHRNASVSGTTTIPYNPVVKNSTNTQQWKVPLSAIQIKIRYVDPKSDQMRDVTIIQSLRPSS